MRVVVNELSALKQRTGVGHYTAELLRCLREQAGPEEVAVFPTGWLRRLSAVDGGGGSRSAATASRSGLSAQLRGQVREHLRSGFRLLREQCFRSYCARERCDLYHETNFIPLASPLPTVATLPDLSVLLHPEWHPRDRVAHFERHFERGLSRCVHFLAISESGRQEVIRTLNIAPERITRTYMGIRPGLRPLPPEEVAAGLHRLGLPERYLLHVGTIEPRKNLHMLLRAYCALPGSLREHCPLLLVGGWGWKASAVAEYLDEEARHRGVLHLGYVADEDLALLYNGARALLFPSWYEGFGMPAVEMLACGGAVLTSTAAALVEVTGGQAYAIPPNDEAGWQAALARVVCDDDWWMALRHGAVAVARRYTWERCAAETLQVYRLLCGVRAVARRAA